MTRIPITLTVFAISIGVALLAAFAVSFTPPTFLSPVHAQTTPSVAIDLSPSDPVEEGTAITVTMIFSNLEQDSDRSTTDYIFRADVGDADACEDQAGGYGLGVDRKINIVDEDPETRRGTISAGCPAGDHTLRASISDADGGELASATAAFSVAAPEPPASTDATLSNLALSSVDIGTFDPATTTYTAEVGNEVEETTVTATVNDDDGATYAVRLDGAADEDGTVDLSVGENVISVVVTAEDRKTTRTYAVTVTRAEALSTDAALSGLALSGIDFGTFDPETTTYTAGVANDVDETAVTPTTNDDGATYAIKLGGAVDEDGVIPLAVGSNVVAVVVTAEDGETTRTYTVTVTRAKPGPVISIGLSPSDTVIEGLGDRIGVAMSFGNLTFDADRATIDYVFRADVVDADECEGSRLGVDRHVHQVDEDPEVRRAAISAGCPAGAHTLRATLSAGGVEVASATARFYVLPPPAAALVQEPAYPVSQHAAGDEDTLTGLSVAHSEGQDPSQAVSMDPTFEPRIYRYTIAIDEDITTDLTVTATLAEGAEAEITYGYGADSTLAQGGKIPLVSRETTRITITVTADDPPTTAHYTIRVARRFHHPDLGIFTYYHLLPDEGGAPLPIRREDVPWLHTQAAPGALSALELTGIPLVFDPATLDYAISVGQDVAQTTITATLADEGASYTVTLDGEADEDGTVELAVGENVIGVVVTAEDGETVTTYTVTVTRAGPPAPTAAVELSPSGPVTAGTEIAVTMSFANLTLDADRATTDYVFRADVKTSNNEDADGCESHGIGVDRYMYQVDENPEVRTGTISAGCPAGDHAIEVTLTSPDDGLLAAASASFSVVGPEPKEPTLSTDATLRSLALSDVTFGAFDPETTSYTAKVGNDTSETTVSPTVNDDGATCVVQLDGVADADGTVDLSVGENAVSVVVTAEDGETAMTYTVTLTRAAALSTDATLKGLALSGVDLGTFDPATTGYTAEVGNDVDETTVTPTVNDGGATYVVKLNGMADDDGVIPLSVGSNVITVEVTAEDGETTLTYIVTLTRAEAQPEATVDLSPSGPVTEGADIAVTMSFANLTPDNDANLVFRADVVGANACEGERIGVDRNMSKVDEDPETRNGTISAACPAGDYTLEVSLTDDGVELASVSASFSVVEPAPTDEPKPSSPPEAPDTPTGQLTGEGQVGLDWNDVAGAAYYQVRFCCGSADWVTLPAGGIEVVFDGSGATVSNLPDYGIYYFSVRAGNAAGVSEWSDYLTLSNAD